MRICELFYTRIISEQIFENKNSAIDNRCECELNEQKTQKKRRKWRTNQSKTKQQKNDRRWFRTAGH